MISGEHNAESRHSLCMIMVYGLSRKVSETYSETSRFESPRYGTYLSKDGKNHNRRLTRASERGNDGNKKERMSFRRRWTDEKLLLHNNNVIRFFAILVQCAVGLHNVFNHATLGCRLGFPHDLVGQLVHVVVAEVVVGHHCLQLARIRT